MKIYSNFQTNIQIPNQKTKYFIGKDILSNLHKLNILDNKYTSILLITDKTVYDLYGDKIITSLKKKYRKITSSIIDSGENMKNTNKLNLFIKPFFEKEFDKSTLLISLGGGVISDIGGFLSSILFRGIDCLHIPTTLLSQTDAAIGGKNGLNFCLNKDSLLKNMIGTIRQPTAVISDIDTLFTLPEKEVLNGLGEIAKYHVGWKKPEYSKILELKKSLTNKTIINILAVSEIITTCQNIKLNIVKKDPFEKKGLRFKLNLGHTFGHALEAIKENKLSHGEAVALGIIYSSKASFFLGLLNKLEFIKIYNLINKLNLPTNTEIKNVTRFISNLKMDKKHNTFVLLEKIGQTKNIKGLDKNTLIKTLREPINNIIN